MASLTRTIASYESRSELEDAEQIIVSITFTLASIEVVDCSGARL